MEGKIEMIENKWVIHVQGVNELRERSLECVGCTPEKTVIWRIYGRCI